MNDQSVEKQDLDSGGDLEVFKVWETIQGEGPFVGVPAVFIRLAGCNLRCSWCDTDYTSRRKTFSPDAVYRQVRELREGGLVVLTGGEPFRQNIAPLTKVLIDTGYHVQVETNGTFWLEEFFWMSTKTTVVCSPKGREVDSRLEPFVDAVKYVVAEGMRLSEADLLPVGLARIPRAEVFVQPRDEGGEESNRKNRELAVSICFQRGYRLSVQVHKLLGLE